jgi:glycyl-tRNA synthetase beta chain
MKWGTGTLRWVRPLKRIVCLFGGQVVPIAIEDVRSGDLTEGHRFMGADRRPFAVRDFASYREGLAHHYVVLESAERRARILEGARRACAERGLELVEDDGLLDEVTGLAEWPVPILGDMDPGFLDLPPEVIRTSMRTHQKYFAVRDPKTGKLAPHFVVVANIEAADGGKALAAGNARVLSARLNDARFFWDEDCKAGFEPWLRKLEGVTFHARLGTMAERVERIVSLAREIAPLLGVDPDRAAEAARLAKADLASGMVGEFPELQGVMGGYYAREGRLPDEIGEAVRDHYKPQGPNDAVPATALGSTVALADKFEMLNSFFSIGEKPSGSRDPYALRRAALGVIRIVLEGKVRFGLRDVAAPGSADDLLSFFVDRLTVLLREQGRRHDLVSAIFALGDDDLVRIVNRVEALDAFLQTDDGANLLAGYKRAANILKAEEKKGELPTGPLNLAHPGIQDEETILAAAVARAAGEVEAHLGQEDFASAMASLSRLRSPVDAFFDKVLVNSDVPEERANRLKLLGQVKDLMGRIADFSLISG